MLRYLQRRLEERKSRIRSEDEAESKRLEEKAEIAHGVLLMNELLKDSRYKEYTVLLTKEHSTCVRALTQLRADADGSASFIHEAGILAGRIAQLDMILNTPQGFFELAAQLEADEAAAAKSKAQRNGHQVPETGRVRDRQRVTA